MIDPARVRILSGLALLLALAGLAIAQTVIAQTAPGQSVQPAPEPPDERYTLSVEAAADVDNDLMTATLAVQFEDEDAGTLAERVNTTMREALATLESLPGSDAIEAQTRDYETRPVYGTDERRELVRWRATQTLELSSSDFDAVVAAVGSLQQTLKLRNLTLSISDAARERATDALIVEALEAFDARATLISETMGASAHRVLEANVQVQGADRPMPMQRMAMDSSSAAESSPAISGGTSRVSVQVFGGVALVR